MGQKLLAAPVRGKKAKTVKGVEDAFSIPPAPSMSFGFLRDEFLHVEQFKCLLYVKDVLVNISLRPNEMVYYVT